MAHTYAGAHILVPQTMHFFNASPASQALLASCSSTGSSFNMSRISHKDEGVLVSGEFKRFASKYLSIHSWMVSCKAIGPLNDGNAHNVVKSLFSEEDIGAEHGEGFETFRPLGPLKVDVDYLNDRMQERGLQRIRYAMKPDEAFGLIYSWDNVLADTRALRWEAWKRLASEEGKVLDENREQQRQILGIGVERVLKNVLCWVRIETEIHRLKGRLAEIYTEELSRIQAPMEGLREWLEALQTAGVPCAVASSLDRFHLLAALQRMGLYKYFQAVVTEEDGMESTAHRFLSASMKLDRPPSKCVVFEDDPRGITAAHNCSMKAVALIGPHPAYELTQADLAVSSFSELSVINLRRLFANKGTEFMDLQKQSGENKPRRRKLRTDTIF